MKGDVGVGVVIVLVMALLAAAIGVSMFTGPSEDLKDLTNNTGDNTSTQVSNASCQRECIRDHPSKGPGYYSCLDSNGCT
jgi:archaellin